MKKSLLFALVVVALAALGAGLAMAGHHHHAVRTMVTIMAKGGPPATAIAGKVKARRHHHRVKRCIRRRTVVVKHNGSKVGSDKTNKKGKYKVPIDAYSEPGKYKAIAKKKHARHHLLCRRGKSKSITV
jgi:ribosomal protein L37E